MINVTGLHVLAYCQFCDGLTSVMVTVEESRGPLDRRCSCGARLTEVVPNTACYISDHA